MLRISGRILPRTHTHTHTQRYTHTLSLSLSQHMGFLDLFWTKCSTLIGLVCIQTLWIEETYESLPPQWLRIWFTRTCHGTFAQGICIYGFRSCSLSEYKNSTQTCLFRMYMSQREWVWRRGPWGCHACRGRWLWNSLKYVEARASRCSCRLIPVICVHVCIYM